MNEAYTTIELGTFQLTLAAALIGLPAVVSVVLRLRLGPQLLLASVRTVAQLLLVGYVLRWVFAISELTVVLFVTFLMILAATSAAIRRPIRTFSGVGWRAFSTLTIMGFATTVTVTGVIVGVKPWYLPQYWIPLLGMVLGNSLNGLSLTLDSLLEHFAERSEQIELELSLGASAWEAAHDPVSRSVRHGMIPIINSMMVVGIVSLPGMMTGQILAGADPLQAVQYQIVVMFMIAAATSLGCMTIAILVFRVLFDRQHRLRYERIRPHN